MGAGRISKAVLKYHAYKYPVNKRKKNVAFNTLLQLCQLYIMKK